MANKINAEYSGASYNLSADVDDCKNGSVSFETTNDWISLSNSGVSPSILTIPENDINTERSAYIRTYLNYDNEKGEPQKMECGNYNIEIKQKGVPCVCNSFEISEFTAIPRSGLPIGNTMFTVERKNSRGTCGYNRFVGSLIDENGVNYPLEMDGQEMKLQKKIEKNNSLNAINYTMTASYSLDDGSYQECKRSGITQPALVCDCNSLNNINLSQFEIPFDGITVPYNGKIQIGTYALTDYCDYMVGKIACDSNTYRLELKCSNSEDLSSGKIYLLDSIPGNDTQGSKTFTISIYYGSFSSSPCFTTSIQQDTSCACSNIDETKWTYYQSGIIPQTGLSNNEIMVSYEIERGNCGTLKAKEINNKFTLTPYYNNETHRGNLKLNSVIEPNTSYTQNEYTIQTYYDFGDRKINCKSFKFYQAGTIPCECSSMAEYNFIINKIPNTGLSVNDSILEYKTKQGSAHCKSNVSGVLKDIDNNKEYTLYNEVGTGNVGYLKLSEIIPKNDEYAPLSFELTVYHDNENYPGHEHEECQTLPIEQLGKITCTCDDMDYFITILAGDSKTHTIILPYEGWSEYQLVASADTAIRAEHDSEKYKKGDIISVCGVVSATSTIEMLTPVTNGQTVNTECGEILVSGYAPTETILNVACGADAEHNIPNHLFYFYTRAESNPERIQKTGYVDLYFLKYKPDGSLGEISECTDAVITAKYKETTCDCKVFEDYRINDYKLSKCEAVVGEETTEMIKYLDLPKDNYLFLGEIEGPDASTPPKIADVYDTYVPILGDTHHGLKIFGHVTEENPEDSDDYRIIGYINLKAYCDPTFSGEPYTTSTWVEGSGEHCRDFRYRILQPPCPKCTCNYLIFSKFFEYMYGEVVFTEISQVGDEIYLSLFQQYPEELDNCEIVYAFFDSCYEGGQPILNENGKFKGMSPEDAYKPNGDDSWFEVYFKVESYIVGIATKLLKRVESTDEVPVNVSAGIKIYDEEQGIYTDDNGKKFYVNWCLCNSINIKKYAEEPCGTCSEEFGSSSPTEMSITNCDDRVLLASRRRCGKLKVVPSDENWSALTDEEAYIKYPWLRKAEDGGGWTSTYSEDAYIYIAEHNDEDSPRTSYFTVFFADEEGESNNTYKGEYCTKKYRISEYKCNTCSDDDCERYYDLYGFNFIPNTSSEYWKAKASEPIGGYFELPYNQGGYPELVIGHFEYSVPDEMADCLKISASTENTEGFMTTKTRFNEETGHLDVIAVINNMPGGYDKNLSYELRLIHTYNGIEVCRIEGTDLYTQIKITLLKEETD